MAKKVALIGNLNNNFFAIARFLRDEGYDAHLFFRFTADHFHPKADTFFLDYQSYCHEVSWLDKGVYNIDVAAVRKDLEGFDFYIGQGDEAAVAAYAGFKMNLYYPYGTDVSKYALLKQEFTLKDKVLNIFRGKSAKLSKDTLKNGTYHKYVRKSIVTADHIFAGYTNETWESKFNQLGCSDKRKDVTMPFLYLKEYNSVKDTASVHWKNEVDKMRNNNDFVVLYHGRVEWNQYESSAKNIDHLIKGFAQYVKKTNNKNVLLAMIEYGNDVAISKDLIKKLGIEQQVKWYPKMYRKDLMYLISNVDICTGEFNHSFLTFGTVIEAMCMGKTVINYRIDELYEDAYDELYPSLVAREPEQIRDAIEYAVDHPEEIADMGAKCRLWMEEYFINQPFSELKKVIEA